MSVSDVFKGQSGVSVIGRVESGCIIKEDRLLCSPINEVSSSDKFVFLTSRFIMTERFYCTMFIESLVNIKSSFLNTKKNGIPKTHIYFKNNHT